jgi:AbrB family looped-hinge helix DNA binding protein
MNNRLKSRSVTVGENGRMNLPADIRRSLGLNGAGKIIIEADENGAYITTFEQRLRKIRASVQPYFTPGVSIVDELIADRRAENAKDEAEMAEHDRLARG